MLGVYRITENFPKHELFGLTLQLRRAAVSVPANIAEGFKKKGAADKARFYNISQGSLEECRYYLILARDLHYADTKELVPFQVLILGFLYWGPKDSGPFLRLATPTLRLEMALDQFADRNGTARVSKRCVK